MWALGSALMVKSSPRIRPFEHLDSLVEIVALGRLRAGRGVSPEPEIEVILADTVPDQEGWTIPYSVFVSCAQIDLLETGSLWRRGVRDETRGPEQSFGATATLRKPEEISGETAPDGRVRPAPGIPVSRTLAGYNLSLSEMDGSSPVSVAWLSTAELFRALFAVSSDFLMDLLLGTAGHFRAKSPLLDKKRSRFDPATRSCHVYSSRQLLHQEAFICAILVSDQAFATASRAPFWRLTRATRLEMGAGVPLEMPWPFSQPVKLEIEGRWAQTQTGTWRFIVTRIRRIEFSPKFERIIVHAPGSGSEVSMTQVGGPVVLGRSGGDLILETGAVPHTRSPARSVVTSGTMFGGMSAVSFSAEVDAGSPGSSPPLFVPEEFASDEGATADPNAAGDPTLAPTRIQRGPSGMRGRTGDGKPAEDREKTDALAKTLFAVEAVCKEMGLILQLLKTPENHGCLACLTLDPSSGREVLIADAGSTPASPRSLGAMAGASRHDLSDADKQQALHLLIELDGKWRSPKVQLGGLRLEAMNRSGACWSDSSHYALRVKDLLSRF